MTFTMEPPKAYALPTTPALSPAPAPLVRKLTPRPYQQEAIEYLRTKKRAGIFDAPGLGKTLIGSEAAVTPCIVAAPSYLVWQWFDHLTEQYSEQTVVLAEGTRKEREAALAQRADWYVINLDMLRAPAEIITNMYGEESKGRHILSYTLPNARTVIIDEAHHMRGRNSQRSKGAEQVCARAEYVFLLTATPIYKAPDDLYQLMRLLDAQTFKSYHDFVDRHCRVWRSPYGSRVLGASNNGSLKKIVQQYGLERTYADVGAQLPDIIKKVIVVRPDDQFKEKYNEIRTKYINIFDPEKADINSLMEAMHLMRRCTAVPKLQAALELLQDEADGIIFTNYTQTAKALAEMLHIPCVTGELTPAERKQISRDAKLVVASIKSMSEGVDLSHLNHVIFFEGSYVPAELYQALSRVRRMRVNPAPVRVTYLYVKGTIDEVIYHIADRRNVNIREIMRAALLD